MRSKLKILTVMAICLMLVFGFSAFAEDNGVITEESAEGINETADISENPFDAVYDEIMSHATEIFSLLSLIGTVMISWFYKRGLLPSVKNVLGNVSTSVIRLKETNDKEIEARKEENTKLKDRLDSFEDALKSQSELISSMESRLISEEDIYRQREKSNIILSSQIDMLYNIFMVSSLPQFQKEAMGEKINQMRKELEGYEKT